MSDRAVAENNEIIRMISGSELYGTSSNAGGDRDEMGVFIAPPPYVIGFKELPQYQYRTQPEGVKSGPGDLDLTIYSLRKFLKLALDGNPSILLMLFVPDSAIIHATWEGKSLLGLKDEFVSKQAYPRFRGYLQSQHMRLTGEKKGHVPSRPELTERFGYDTKYAMHTLRLGFQGIELMETGKITLPIPSVPGDFLRGVRNGEYSYDEVIEEIEAVEAHLEASHDKSDLPDEPNYKLVEDWSIVVHQGWWKK